MGFEIGNPWHWLFLAMAMGASARAAWKALFDGIDASDNPLFQPFVQFWIALFGTSGGWFAMWSLLPLVHACAAPACNRPASAVDVILVIIAAIGMPGFVPDVLHWLVRLCSNAATGIDPD